MAGNLASGRLLHAGWPPTRLLATGFTAMGLAAAAAFAAVEGAALPAALRYAAILVFSMVGGLIPATLFSLALRLAPSEQTLSTTVGCQNADRDDERHSVANAALGDLFSHPHEQHGARGQ